MIFLKSSSNHALIVRSRGELIEYQSILEFPQRGARHVDMAYIPARDVEGRVIGVVVRVHDIDNLKKMGETLQTM